MKPRNRPKWMSVLASPVTLVAAVVLLAFLGRAAWSIHEKAVASSAKLDLAESNLAKLETSQTDLAEKTAELSTPAGVEAALREKYRAVKPGESVAVIVDDSGPDASIDAATSSHPEASGGGWLSALLRFLGLR